MPAAAYRASMPEPVRCSGPATGVSGGGGEPLWARVVEMDAVEPMRLMELGFETWICACAEEEEEEELWAVNEEGGGKYC